MFAFCEPCSGGIMAGLRWESGNTECQAASSGKIPVKGVPILQQPDREFSVVPETETLRNGGAAVLNPGVSVSAQMPFRACPPVRDCGVFEKHILEILRPS
ncbi:hypothetical protein Q31a_01940 [Aureliella helgolandensis]|uniref:Uncharacterized protein n=1 Tax=Aureliella helgolandensis TaxID=2527968 RepID=A0A518FZY8_9BACT|nr:hypothetical protein Q31a_01940 [Aureliella helgolandensis]